MRQRKIALPFFINEATRLSQLQESCINQSELNERDGRRWRLRYCYFANLVQFLVLSCTIRNVGKSSLRSEETGFQLLLAEYLFIFSSQFRTELSDRG